MSDYVIEKGVPFRNPRGNQVAVLEQMEIGDSFFEPNPRRNWRMDASLRGIKVSQAKEGAGLRIWRVA